MSRQHQNHTSGVADTRVTLAPASSPSLSTLVSYFALPVLVTTLLLGTTLYAIDVQSLIAAFLLLFIAWTGFIKWRKTSSDLIPLYALIAGLYWLYYGLPLFWGDRDDLGAGSKLFHLMDETATDAMLLALLGVLSLGLGIKLGIGRRWVLRTPPEIRDEKKALTYIRGLLIVGVLFSLFKSLTYLLGEEGRQIIIALQKDVPLFAFAFLFQRYLRGTATKPDKILIVGFLGISCLEGLSSGWLGAFGTIVIICGIMYVAEKKKIPYLLIALFAFYILFFQVGKNAVRGKYWYGQDEGNAIQRAEFWVSESLDQWQKAFLDPSGQSLQNLAHQSLARLSLLNQTGNVLQRTPSEVPYQYGHLYSYMFVTLIPRFVWPDKPSVNDANRFYQVAYGLTDEKNLNKVSIAVGVLTEAYINFGWVGVAGVMLFIGIVLDFVQKTFLNRNSGKFFAVVGIVLIPYFILIEAQMAQYLGGLVQKVVVLMIVMSPILSRRKSSETALEKRPVLEPQIEA